MHMCVKNLLACCFTDIRTEIKAPHIRVFTEDFRTTLQGKLVQRFSLFGSGSKNIGHMPLWNYQRVKPPHRKFVSNGEC